MRHAYANRTHTLNPAATTPTTDHLTNLLGAFVTVVGDELNAALAEAVGLGGSAPAALLAVDTWPDRPIDFLAGVLDLSHSGTVRLVDRLESEGLVERGAGANGRTCALRATPGARGRIHAARSERHRILSAFTSRLDEQTASLLEAALDGALREGDRTRTQARHACRVCEHSVCGGSDCPVGMSVRESEETD